MFIAKTVSGGTFLSKICIFNKLIKKSWIFLHPTAISHHQYLLKDTCPDLLTSVNKEIS